MRPNLAYFEVLGLDAPPADRKAVKRAYSKKLKVTRPEEDPDGFMRLRDAHDLALQILARQAETAAWEAQSITVEASYSQNTISETAPDSDPNLTYADMLPSQGTEPQEEIDTTYAIGATPNFDAPVNIQDPQEPKTVPLLEDLNAILGDPKFYNDREQWNLLFRKARQLDIDDYVDFEQSLLDIILNFHGYFDGKDDHSRLGGIEPKFTPSITASLFKTMNWDKVNTQGYHRSQQIEWLERRMGLRKRTADPVPIPATKSVSTGKLWFIIIGAFILTQLLFALANS